MKIEFRKSFYKDYAKLDKRKQIRVDDAIRLFGHNPNHTSLRMHKLKGRYASVYSISAGGDLRLHFVFELVDEQTAAMIAVGTHAQLYE